MCSQNIQNYQLLKPWFVKSGIIGKVSTTNQTIIPNAQQLDSQMNHKQASGILVYCFVYTQLMLLHSITASEYK